MQPSSVCLLGSSATVARSRASLFLEDEGPWGVQVRSPQTTQHPRVPREVWLSGGRKASTSMTCGNIPQRRPQAQAKTPQGCPSFLTAYGPLQAVLPFALPSKPTPDIQVSQGLGKRLSKLVTSLVFVYSAEIWALCTNKLHTYSSAGAPSLCGPKAPPAGTPGRDSTPTRSPPPSTLRWVSCFPPGQEALGPVSQRGMPELSELRCLSEGQKGSLDSGFVVGAQSVS